ncbi:hypothetical protein LX81_00276 [Palleronia aestuarii]|uniref:Uncharacterized protein n=1 Tax=Palleronia aestuarii TaxID=568105 RepID=A0A2W7NK34_9RHOB|nr:hypothetical protein [Palleronia aestuarii]PZX19813.1 hypothetical protein LX81_00276 [Palleronia aestuarii]
MASKTNSEAESKAAAGAAGKAEDKTVSGATTLSDVNTDATTITGPSVEDARAGTTKLQNRIDQNVPSGSMVQFDPARMGLDPTPYGSAAAPSKTDEGDE